jgi:hypothetical protein
MGTSVNPSGEQVSEGAIASQLLRADLTSRAGQRLTLTVLLRGHPLGWVSPSVMSPPAPGVVHLAHLVDVHEGVQGAQVHAGEVAADGEAFALQPGGAEVTERTGRSAAAGSGSATRGRAMVSALMAGMCAPWCRAQHSGPGAPRQDSTPQSTFG